MEKDNEYLKRNRKTKKIQRVLADIEENHNHSWYQEMIVRSEKYANMPAIFYRGNKILFHEMMESSAALASALRRTGIGSGEEVGVCMCNVPELAYVMLALNKLAAKMNSFSAEYNENYIETILRKCSKKVLFITDSEYRRISNLLNNADIDNIVIISKTRSLPGNPECCDEYEASLAEYYKMKDETKTCLLSCDRCITYDDYLDKYKGDIDVEEVGTLDTEFLVTYTSGSTKIGFPKAIIHTNRSLIVSGRFHDAEVSGNPDLRGLRALAMIHPDSNTCLITCISDILMQGWCVAFEPEYKVENALDYLMINKPNYANMTSSFWNMAAIQYLVEKRFAERKLEFLLAAFAVGENIGNGEERFLNRFLKKAKAGSGLSIKGFHMPYVTISIGGGDCEHGGIYYTLWKTLYSKLYALKLRGKPIGMLPEKYVLVSALKECDGKLVECEKNELGLIVANSATTMRGYRDNAAETWKKIVTDNKGHNWVSCNVIGYIDEVGAVHVKGRAEEYRIINGKKVYPFNIDDVIDQDTNNILSSISVFDSNDCIVANIILNPFTKESEDEIVDRAMERCHDLLHSAVYSRLRIRVFHSIEEFPITMSGKRNIRRLEELSDQERMSSAG